MRPGREPRIFDHGPRPARSRGWRVATDLASCLDGKFPAPETRNGHGRVYHGRSGRADTRADGRRMAYLQLLMALDLLYQSADRHSGRGINSCISRRPAIFETL